MRPSGFIQSISNHFKAFQRISKVLRKKFMLEHIQLKIPAQPLTQNPVRGDLSVVIPAHKTSAAHRHRYAIPTEATPKIKPGQAYPRLAKPNQTIFQKNMIFLLYPNPSSNIRPSRQLVVQFSSAFFRYFHGFKLKSNRNQKKLTLNP